MTLLSIVGEDISRIIPVLYAYKNQIKHHVLLCDDDSSNYERARTLQKGMQKFSAKHSLGWYTKIITTNEDSATDIKESAQKQFNNESELWLNATDGYPAITILLSDLVRKEGGKVLSYDHFDNDLHIIEPDGNMETKQLPVKMDLDSYITLLDYKIVSQGKKYDLLKRKEYIMELYKDEASYATVKDALVDLQLNRIHSFNFSSHLHTIKILKYLGIVDNDNRLIPSQQKVLQGDLLEEYLYWLCVSLNSDDIAVGVKIDFDDSKQEPEYGRRVHNEFDVLMIHNNRIYTIECKFSNGLKGLDVVYKYDAIIDYFGKSSKAIIANISSRNKEDYIGMKKSSNFNHSTLRRARMSGITIYHESKIDAIRFKNLVQNFFNIKG